MNMLSLVIDSSIVFYALNRALSNSVERQIVFYL